MLCKQYEALSHKERTEFIGNLTHLVQTYEWAFNLAYYMEQEARKIGLFEGVAIAPESNPIIENQENQIKNELAQRDSVSA